MVVCGYIFDIIIVRIDAPNTQFEDSSQLSVDAVFNNVPLKITSSRINVVEFRSGSSYEFNANPEELKSDMKKNPLKLTVMYKTDTVGSGRFEWPDTVLNRISECVGELTHMDECELKSEEIKVGSVEIIIRLKTKCQEMEDEAGAVTTGDDIRKQLNKVINPHDVLFVVGDTNKDDICAALLPQVSQLSNEAQHSTALDLSRYRSVNGRLVQTPDILNTCGNVECCELKKISNEYQKLIDTLMSCPGGNRSLPLERPSCRASCNSNECGQDNKFSESGSSTRDSSEQKFPCTCFAAQHNSSSGAFEGEKLVNICPRDSPPELQQTTFISNRKCPICKENLAWLPKLSACPKCGYKPVPYVEEKPYNTQMTADQILQEYLDKLSSSTDNKGDGKEKDACCDDKKECRCTCKNGKVCAHCRIRKLCEDIFQTKTVNSGENAADDCRKCETKSSQDAYNICKSSSKDCRPYLARVFSELRELYNIKETKRKAFEVNQRCERALNKNDAEKKPHNPSKAMIGAQHQQEQQQQHQEAEDKQVKSVKHNQQEETIDRKMFLTKNFKKSNEACKPKIYNYSAVRKCPVKSLRHKMCVNGFAAGRKTVPHNMGWLWNVDTEGTRRGWKPGAIRKPIKCLMKYFLNDFPADTLRVSQYSYRKECKGECKEEEELVQKPTLHICKKNDEYFITLRPLKDAEALRHCADPYLNMKPIEFKITKNPLLNAMRNLKRNLKDMGFAKCTCHMPVVDCCCRNFLDKKRLEYQVNKECRKRCLPCCSQTLVLSDTTDSDVEFDFGVTPPAGVIKPERLKKPNLVNHGTQYEQGDWNVMPVFPKPPNKYMKQYNCATGDRYDTTGGAGRKKGDGGAGKGGGKAGGGGGRGGGKAGGGGRAGGAGGGGAAGKGGAGSAQRKKGDGEKGGDRERGGAAGSAGPGGKPTRGEKGGPNSYFGDKNKGGSNEDKKKRLRKLAEMPPPLICMVDRRGKPADPCAFVCDDVCGYPRDICADVCCIPRGNNRIC